MPRPRNYDRPVLYEILAYIIQFKMDNDGLAPSVRELMSACGLSTISAVTYNLARLEEAGLIERKFNTPRCIVVVGGEWRMSEGKGA